MRSPNRHRERVRAGGRTESRRTRKGSKNKRNVQVDDKKVMVSELAVRIGHDFRIQLALLVLFRVVTSKEHVIRKGWKDVST